MTGTPHDLGLHEPWCPYSKTNGTARCECPYNMGLPLFRQQPSPSESMHIRDYFAGQALSAAIGVEVARRSTRISPGDFDYQGIAEACYVVADAMLKVREGGHA